MAEERDRRLRRRRVAAAEDLLDMAAMVADNPPHAFAGRDVPLHLAFDSLTLLAHRMQSEMLTAQVALGTITTRLEDAATGPQATGMSPALAETLAALQSAVATAALRIATTFAVNAQLQWTLLNSHVHTRTPGGTGTAGALEALLTELPRAVSDNLLIGARRMLEAAIGARDAQLEAFLQLQHDVRAPRACDSDCTPAPHRHIPPPPCLQVDMARAAGNVSAAPLLIRHNQMYAELREAEARVTKLTTIVTGFDAFLSATAFKAAAADAAWPALAARGVMPATVAAPAAARSGATAAPLATFVDAVGTVQEDRLPAPPGAGGIAALAAGLTPLPAAASAAAAPAAAGHHHHHHHT